MLDITAIGIAFGLVGVVSYVVVGAVRSRSFDLATTVLVFLAFFSLPAGVLLISVAFSGNLQYLPASWREYIAVAGIAVIGLGVQFVAQSYRNAWRKKATSQARDVDSNDS